MSVPGVAFPGQGNARETARAGLQRQESHPLVRAAMKLVGGASAVLDLNLNDTAVAQPMTYALGLAAVSSAGARDAPLAVGHSLGELTAAAFLGAVDPEEGLHLAARRGQICAEQQRRRPGAMAAVMGTDASGVEMLRRLVVGRTGAVLEIAGLNGRRQTVVSGDMSAMAELEATSAELGLLVNRLPIGGAFHSPLMVEAIEEWSGLLQAAGFRDTTVPLVSTVDAAVHTSGEEMRELLRRALLLPVRWAEALRTVVALGVDQLWDAGPGTTLARLARREGVVSFVDTAHESAAQVTAS